MAVIKSGNSTDQMRVDTHLSAQVTLADASGNPVTPLGAGGSVSVANFPATQPISGTVAVSNFPASTSVSNFPATQAVSAAALPLPAGAATEATVAARLPLAANGALTVTSTDGFKATYAAGTSGLTLAAAATDVLTITGSATKTVKITKVYLSFTATTAISVPVSLIRRATANTGGTTAIQAATTHDTNNAATTAVVVVYTVNAATLGTTVGTVLEAGKVPAPLTGGAVQVTVFEFGTTSNQAVALRGTAQSVAINLNGTTVAGGSLAVTIQWTEE